MYINPAFRMSPADTLAFLRERGFGILVLPTNSGAPTAVHVPFLASEQTGNKLRLELHVARANPIHFLIGPDGTPALFICQGPDAYISPDWYGVPNQVPTWTYVAAHLSGTVRLLPKSDYLAHVDRLSAEFENRLLPKKPWTSSKMDETRRQAMLSAIVGLEFVADTVEAMRKLIQHKGETEHRGAIAGLSGQPDEDSHAIAALMQQTFESKFSKS